MTSKSVAAFATITRVCSQKEVDMSAGPIQLFAEQIAADAVGVDVSAVRELMEKRTGSVVGRDWASFLAFLQAIAEMIMELMGNCPMSDERLREVVRDPGFMQRVRVRRTARECLNNTSVVSRGWRSYVGEVSDAILTRGPLVSDATLDEILEEVREYNSEG
jgi:hypothetical protein